MKLFSKDKLNTKVISMMMAVFLTVMVCSTGKSYAKEIKVDYWKTNSYGNSNMDETFYLWHQVKSDQVPMFTYLSDGKNSLNKPNTELYGNQKKQFRVMIFHHYTGNYSGSLGGELGTVKRLANLDGGQSYTTAFYDTWLQYKADYSRIIDGSTDNYAGPDSLVSFRANTQLKPGDESFITRGAQQSFFCDYSGVWENNGKYRDNSDLAGEYRGKYRYHFYYPDESDTKPVVTLTYTEGMTYTNFYLFDSNGDAWGHDFNQKRSYFQTAKDPEKGTGRLCIDTWAVVGKTPETMTFPSYDGSGKDYTLGIGDQSANFVLNKWDKASETHFMIYVGEPCPPELMQDMNPSKDAKDWKLSDGSYRAITTPEFLKKDEEFVVGENAVLVVSSLLVLRGKIVNHGIIIVEKNGAIFSWDNGFGSIVNDGGDVIVKKGGIVFVHDFKAGTGKPVKPSTIQLYQPLYSLNTTVSAGVIDSRNAGAKITQAKKYNDFSFMQLVKGKDGYNVQRIELDTSKLKFSGSEDTTISISKDVKQINVDK